MKILFDIHKQPAEQTSDHKYHLKCMTLEFCF